MSITLEDIAKVSGYSRSTVSRVINNEAGVSKKAKERVSEVIREMHYHPNQAARGLAAGKMRTIGLVFPESIRFIFTDPFFMHLALGVSRNSAEHNYSVMLWLEDPEVERRSIQKFINNGLVDGVIVASTSIGDPIIKILEQGNIPFVLVGRQPGLDDVNYVDMDNYSGTKEAVNYLIGLGYQRIATITGPMDMIAGQHRYRGFIEALREGHQNFDPNLVVEGDFSDQSGYLGMKALLCQKPDAVFIASDTMAIGALQAIHEAGLTVPDDIAVVGFDDIPMAKLATPALTTIRQPVLEMGQMAADVLINLLENPGKEVQHLIMEPELIVRKSCGCMEELRPEVFK